MPRRRAAAAAAAAAKKPSPADDARGASRAAPPSNRRIHVSREAPHVAPGLQLHERRNVLRIGVYAQFFPVAYVDPATKQYAGLDVDLMRRFCARFGLTPRFVRIADFDDAPDAPARWDQRLDVAIGGIGRSSWRNAGGVEWSVHYFRVQRAVVYHVRAPIRRFPEDVTGKVAGTMGSIGFVDAVDRFRAIGKDPWELDLLEARWKTTDARDLADLMSGKLQGLMRGSFVAKALVRQHPGVLGMSRPWSASARAVGPGGEVFAFPCRRGSGLAAAITLFLLDLSARGELARLIRAHGM